MKRTLTALAYALITTSLTACGVPQSEHDAVVAENISLKSEIDELKNGEGRLIAIIKQSYTDGEYGEVKEAIAKIKTIHPQSGFIANADSIFQEISQIEKAQVAKRQTEAKEKKRLANLNNTGMWQVVAYVDDFGEPSKNKYIRNHGRIRGVFSNSATEESELDVTLLIDGLTEVDIRLYEYAGNNPVKAYSPDEYRVLLQDKDGNRHRLKATNYGDRLSFGPKHSGIITTALKKGGRVKFRITEVDTPTTQYGFETGNAQYFDNAIRILQERK